MLLRSLGGAQYLYSFEGLGRLSHEDHRRPVKRPVTPSQMRGYALEHWPAIAA